MIDLIRDFPFPDARTEWAQDSAEFNVDSVICAAMRATWAGWTHTQRTMLLDR